MEKKDLIKFCKYYKGESTKSSDPEIQTLQKNEEEWVELTLNYKENQPNVLSDVLDEYLAAGMREFQMFDSTPATLKAVLFNRFMKYNERYDIDAFKEWYQKNYTSKEK